MTTYLAPGVYVEEVPSGPQPIAAVSTSVVAIVGSTARGPSLEPTRVTGWSDFQRVFQGNAGVGYTAEAAYGYFENGGPAAYIVRVDPSTPAAWEVRDTAATKSFSVTATSGGSWSNNLAVSTAPDRVSGAAQLFKATVTADVTFTGEETKDVAVDSTTGISAGDSVVLINFNDTGTKKANGTVTQVASGSVRVAKSGAGSTIELKTGSVVAGRLTAAATQFRLSGSGVKVGDVLEASTADGARTSWRVTAVAAQGAALLVTVATGAAVDGAQFANRVVRVRGATTKASASVLLTDIGWTDDVLGLSDGDMKANLHAWAANGMEGQWTTGSKAFTFPADAPAGPIEVEIPLTAHLFADSRLWKDPSLEQLAEAYSFVPQNTELELTVGNANPLRIKRTAAGFEKVSGDLSPANPFDTVRFKLPTNAGFGILVRCVRPPATTEYIRLAPDTILPIKEVEHVGGTLFRVLFDSTADLSAGTLRSFDVRAFVSTSFVPLRFSLSVSGTIAQKQVSETYGGLALDPVHPQYYAKDGIVNGVSATVKVTPRDAGASPPDSATTPAFAIRTAAGADVVPTPQDYRKGVDTLETETESAMLICPDLLTMDDKLVQYDLVDALVSHCQTFHRLAILDAPNLAEDQKLLEWRNAAVSSTYAAIYTPFLQMVNLDAGAAERHRFVPPSGFVAGVMARTDRTRGVHKAPGNERVNGIVGLAQQYTQSRQEFLNPRGVNLIRTFPGRGIRIWGARNATDDTTWTYVNVRRLFNMVELSVDRSTQWVVFEPNTPTTWLRIRASVEGFLDQLWRSGALLGATPKEAYQVRVGLGQTMTQTDIDLGLVITEVALAPAKPAEFVVFRFSHKRLSE